MSMEIHHHSSDCDSSDYEISTSDEECGGGEFFHTMYERRVEESRDFCETMLFDVALSRYEKENIRCNPESYKEARRRILSETGAPQSTIDDEDHHHHHHQPRRQCDPSLEALDKDKKVFTIKRDQSTLTFIIENYVHVTYFVNSLTGQLCRFNLKGLANDLVHYYVEYSCKKFAKVNLRYRGFLSHLLYTSSVVVETGSDNQEVSRRLLEKTVTILREECGYTHINIRRRTCHNIVATGRVNYIIALNVLKQRFQNARDKDSFTGIVIKLRDLKKYFEKEKNKIDWSGYYFTDNYVDDDDDSEVIEAINSVNPSPFSSSYSRRNVRVRERKGYEEDEEDSEAEEGEEDEEEEEIRCITRMTDEYDLMGMNKRHNGTFLVFKEGQIICTGCKSEKELLEAFTLIYALLEKCKYSEKRNQDLEKSIIGGK